jgi:hypothetical protein
METTQGNSCVYFYLKLPKMLFLFLSFMLFFYKIREQEGGTGSAQGWRCGVVAPVGAGRWWGKG